MIFYRCRHNQTTDKKFLNNGAAASAAAACCCCTEKTWSRGHKFRISIILHQYHHPEVCGVTIFDPREIKFYL